MLSLYTSITPQLCMPNYPQFVDNALQAIFLYSTDLDNRIRF